MATISGKDFLGGKPAQVVQPANSSFQPSFLNQQSEQSKNYLQRVGGDYMNAAQNIISDVSRPFKTINENPNASALDVMRQSFEAGGRTIGNVAGAAFSPITQAISPIVEPVVRPVVQKLTEIPGVSEATKFVSNWASTYPEAAKDLEAIFNIATLGVGGSAVKTGEKFAGEALKTGENVAKTALSGAKDIAQSAKTTLFGRKAIMSIDDVIKQADDGLKLANKTATPSDILKTTENITAKPSLIEKWAGISPDIKNRIAGKQEKLKEYFDVAHARNNFDTLPTPLEYGAKNVDLATKKMEELISDTGSKIGSFRRKIGTYEATPDAIKSVDKSFNDQLLKLNLEVKNGTIRQIPGTVSRVASKSDIPVLQDLFNDLQRVKQNPNLEKLIDLRSVFDNKINFSKTAREASNSLDPVSRVVRKQIADVAAKIVGKSEATNLKEFSDFMDAYTQLKSYTDRKAGAEFLLKQVLSERGRTPRELMNAIKKNTGIDLMDDATMAQIATDLIGNSRQKGLFRQEITKAGLDAASVLKGNTGGAIDLMTTLGKKVITPEKQFLKAAR